MSIYGDGIARVSDVLSVWNGDGDGLVRWAARQGFSWEKVRQHAADVGTHSHEIVEATLRSWRDDGDIKEQTQKAASEYMKTGKVSDDEKDEVRLACMGWMQWANGKEIKPERLEHTLVDEHRGFGGTADFKGYVGGVRCLLDWKTSKGFYRKYKVQLAAYALLHELHCPDEKIDSYGVIRMDKTMGTYEDIYWSNLDEEKLFFLSLLDVYKMGRAIKL